MELDWARLPTAMIWFITLPCIDFARSGGHLGRHGKTGHLYVLVVQPLLTKWPKVFVHEMSDYADKVNGGDEVRMVIALLSEEYVVYMYNQIRAMADYGDCCHRKRLVLVGFRKDFACAGAHEWGVPAAKYGEWKPHCARDIAEPDEDVDEEDQRTGQLHTVYANVPVPAFGQLQKLGRLFPGFKMGPGCNPYLWLGWDGTKNGPTTHGGGTFLTIVVLSLLCGGSKACLFHTGGSRP